MKMWHLSKGEQKQKRKMGADGKEAKPTSEARDEASWGRLVVQAMLSGRPWMEVVVGLRPGLASESGKALPASQKSPL